MPQVDEIHDERHTIEVPNGWFPNTKFITVGRYSTLQKSHISNGRNRPESAYSVFAAKQETAWMSWPPRWDLPDYVLSVTVDVPDNVLTGWGSNDELELITSLGHTVRQHDFHAGKALGEAGQTLRLIGTTARRIAMALTALKHGNLPLAYDSFASPTPLSLSRHGMKRLRSKPRLTDKWVADQWLELQYGWKPLLSDIHTGMGALSTTLNGIVRLPIKVRKSVNNTGYYNSRNEFWLRKCRKVNLKTFMLSYPLMNASLNLNDPLSVAWEVMPWSFVIDWFIPIGGFLEATGMNRGLDYGPITRTDVNIDQRVITALGRKTYGSSTIIGNPSYNSFSMMRNPSYSLPTVLPLPEFNFMHDALSVGHVINAIALLTSVRSR